MLIGGLQPFTLSDYPGTVAAVIFTQGCNFRCPFCHNGSLLPMRAPSRIPAERVWDLLERRRGKLKGVVITGGEPTLHADLPEFVRRIRELGYRVKLDTNGSAPAMLRRLLAEGLLDYVAMDVKAPWRKYSDLCGVKAPVDAVRESMRLIAESGLCHEFRTTWVPALLSEGDVSRIRAAIPAGSPYKTQEFIPELAFDESLRPAPSVRPADVAEPRSPVPALSLSA